MAFEDSIVFSLQMEGRYCDEPGDKGGETYKGVARNFWPNWEGWAIIDQAKAEVGLVHNRAGWRVFSDYLEQNADLQNLVYAFYNAQFWQPQYCDAFHPAIGHLLLDFGINSGLSRAAKHLQRGCIALGNAITADGILGAQSIAIAQNQDPASLAEAMLQDRLEFYHAIVAKKPDQVKFLKGWENRVESNRQYIAQNLLG